MAPAAAQSADLRTAVRSLLVSARNPDGGWGYLPGKGSRLEPTCWALLALGRLEGRSPEAAVLQSWRREGGWLVDVAGAPFNVAFNALAGLTLGRTADATRREIVASVVESRGVSLANHDAIRQDNSLQAWSWIEGTFSWVEPTAWCLLLLKQQRTGAGDDEAAERIRVGEQMLADRSSDKGGWNYGNAEVFGQDLPAHVPTTALALVALQDRRALPAVARGLAVLQEKAPAEQSTLALALAAICLTVFGLDTRSVVRDLEALLTRDLEQPAAFGTLLGPMAALYALAGDGRPMREFSL